MAYNGTSISPQVDEPQTYSFVLVGNPILFHRKIVRHDARLLGKVTLGSIFAINRDESCFGFTFRFVAMPMAAVVLVMMVAMATVPVAMVALAMMVVAV